MTPCTCPEPRHCPAWGRFVVWADIHSCQSNGPPGATVGGLGTSPPPEPQVDCRTCIHRGEPMLAATGHQVGTEGCGCTAASVPSGLLWWVCNKRGGPVREDRARNCGEFKALS